MSLLSYREARPWARGMARAVENGDMPPWSGESEHVVFRDDLSLSAEQIATITDWAAGGAPEGDPADLPPAPTFREGWALGEPDYVLTLDRVDVPTEGPDLFPKQRIALELEEERWVQAIEFLPGDRRATHHFQATYTTPRRESGGPIGSGERVSEGAGGSGLFGIWTAGMPPYVFPEGTGRVLGPGTTITMDSHYHPFGEATSDVTRIGDHDRDRRRTRCAGGAPGDDHDGCRYGTPLRDEDGRPTRRAGAVHRSHRSRCRRVTTEPR